MRRIRLRSAVAAIALAIGATAVPATAETAEPESNSPEYVARDLQNMRDAYGRITRPGGQLQNPAYLPALVEESSKTTVAQVLDQVATPNRLALTPGQFFPGWNVGNPLRAGWDGTRGQMKEISYTNRYGALIRGTVYAPLRKARDPYTGERLRPPYPGVVITTGSVQASEGMYRWLAQDLAERGYVVMTYDVQGQGTSETLPHQGPINALPFCNPFAEPEAGEMFGCPGVPSQQLANFTKGTVDALDFFVSTPRKPYQSPASDDVEVEVDKHNPFWKLWDRSKDRRTDTPGRNTRIAIIGHSMGAAAVSHVQGYDDRVMAVVALDKLAGPGNGEDGPFAGKGIRPTVPALALQAEYGFEPTPYPLSGGSSITPQPSPEGPDPRRERQTGYNSWVKAGVDSMLVVPRASTHSEWTDIPLVLPASRHGQALSSVYVQAWLDRYLKHDRRDKRLLAKRFRYLEPIGNGDWEPITLRREKLLSFYYCSAYSFRSHGSRVSNGDIADVGGCA